MYDVLRRDENKREGPVGPSDPGYYSERDEEKGKKWNRKPKIKRHKNKKRSENREQGNPKKEV